MSRVTRSMVESAFERLADASGARILDPSWKITDKRRDGAWKLDHNGVYGGYVIAAICPSSPPREGEGKQTYTAETMPLGYERKSAAEFFDACNFACRALAFRKSSRRR